MKKRAQTSNKMSSQFLKSQNMIKMTLKSFDNPNIHAVTHLYWAAFSVDLVAPFLILDSKFSGDGSCWNSSLLQHPAHDWHSNYIIKIVINSHFVLCVHIALDSVKITSSERPHWSYLIFNKILLEITEIYNLVRENCQGIKWEFWQGDQ